MAILESAAFWIIVAAASEIIALSPLKDNSIIQLVLHAVNSIKPKKGWVTYPQTGNGCLDLTAGRTTIQFIAPFNRGNFTPPYLTN